MKAAIYGKTFNVNFIPVMKSFINNLFDVGAEVWIVDSFMTFVRNTIPEINENIRIYKVVEDLPEDLNYLFSIGGDGTFLEAAAMAKGRNIPIVGINSGRLGFLANISKEDVKQSIDYILRGEFTVEERSLIEIRTSDGMYYDFALNEIAIQKKNSRMITIHAYLNGELLNSYWADGLIISTPTGSTAYSLSVGGPIVIPGSRNFIISPISPHTLAVRPVVIPDYHEIRLKVDGRSSEYLVSADYRSYNLNTSVDLFIKRADETVKMLRLPGHSFYKTIRSNLMWGMDKRN